MDYDIKTVYAKANAGMATGITALGILQEDGFDYDRLREALVGLFPPEGLRLEADQINNFVSKFLGKLGPILNFQVQGGVTFHRTDLEKLLDYIKEA